MRLHVTLVVISIYLNVFHHKANGQKVQEDSSKSDEEMIGILLKDVLR